MIAVEEKDLQSVKTDASLYNGQPTDTGTQCHNVGYSIVKGETLKKVTPVITFRKTRKYEESNN